MRRHCCFVGCLLLLGACGDSGGSENNTSQCPDGYEQSGPACIPIFDDCPGAAEIPVLGGGCQAVGVTTCATGLFESDGEGGCEPILPDHTCPPGTMEMLGHTECQPVGVTACAAGFESDGEGGCNAILPPGPDPCPPGTIALLGYDTCQPLGDCGTGTWGNLVDDGVTVYVHQTADATGANGTQQAPFLTVGEALAVVAPGGRIAVAAGDYTERLNLSQEVRLTGRCAELVTIRGQQFMGNPVSPVTINSGGSSSTVRGVTLTGPAEGLVLSGAQQVVVRQVQVLDASDVGIEVRDEAEVLLEQVVVAGCVRHGVYARGGTLELVESEVRDSRPQPGTGEYGRGINVQCSSGESCGSLQVTSSVVSGNRAMGMFISGVDTEITATLVRDTQPRQNNDQSGRGINAQCSSGGTCGSLRVTASLVSGNRTMGVYASGVATEITDTVIRDTLPELSSESMGRGITAQCSSGGPCGSLRVSSSLVSGNRDVGILAGGVDAEISTTLIRDTLLEESTGSGAGIVAQCDPEGGSCGSLLVSSCLVSGNRQVGIYVSNVSSEISATVVRDTLSGGSTDLESSGSGIVAQCSSAGSCGSLRVSSSVVSGNRDVGITTIGMENDVYATVVRDTQPDESNGMYGRGISAQCYFDGGLGPPPCGGLRVSFSLVTGNRELGIFTFGVDTEVTSTVVRDTLPEESSGKYGRGIAIQCDSDVGACGRLRVADTLVSGNRDVGIFAGGVGAEITTTVIRGTLPDASNGKGGRGISSQCDVDEDTCGSLLVSSSLVRSNENIGIFIGGVPATLEGVAVIDTRANAQGPKRDIHGQGIAAMCHPDTGDCGDLSMTSCLVDSSQSAGLLVEGVSGFIASSSVRSVAPQPLDDKYGYGVQIGGLELEEMPTFDITDCDIQNAELAGILYYRARGTVARSVVSGAENSVVMNEGSEPTILDNNNLSGTVTDAPTWANLFPSPAPEPSLPSE
ncbi:MAG: DUF1565 domain-containing protein [bacterium]